MLRASLAAAVVALAAVAAGTASATSIDPPEPQFAKPDLVVVYGDLRFVNVENVPDPLLPTLTAGPYRLHVTKITCWLTWLCSKESVDLTGSYLEPNWQASFPLGTGDWTRVIVSVDSLDQVAERNETNNTAVFG